MELSDVYSSRIVGLNHRTLSESPAQNALDLVRQLPPKARLHLLTHSRGGLVGELLALGPLPPDALNSLALSGRPIEEIRALRDLADLLAAKQLRVERFVRVACPVRGTILASERLDRYLSVLLNLIGLIPAVDETLIYPFAKAAILSLIKQHTRPEQLPGLEAMMPESPFIRLLNLQGVASATDLAVIAGDVEGSGLFGRLGVLAADLFFWQDHDLVVNTDSMFKGMDREPGIYYSYEKGPEITHFNYFKNDISRQRIKAWLVRKPADPIPAGFRKLEGEPIPEISRSVARGDTPDAPVVFLIPTLMGTHLRLGDQRIWLDTVRLGEGQFAKLRLDGGKETVAIDEIATWGYGELINFLSDTFQDRPLCLRLAQLAGRRRRTAGCGAGGRAAQAQPAGALAGPRHRRSRCPRPDRPQPGRLETTNRPRRTTCHARHAQPGHRGRRPTAERPRSRVTDARPAGPRWEGRLRQEGGRADHPRGSSQAGGERVSHVSRRGGAAAGERKRQRVGCEVVDGAEDPCRWGRRELPPASAGSMADTRGDQAEQDTVRSECDGQERMLGGQRRVVVGYE